MKPIMRPPVDAECSPFARLRPLPFSAVTLRGGFWGRRQEVNRSRSLSHGHAKLVETGVLRNFEKAKAGAGGAYEGKRYADSDLYKWLEAASYELGNSRVDESPYDPALKGQVDEAVKLVCETQRSDGYLYTYYQVLRSSEERWQHLDEDHELYCAGHLFQAALAHYRCTGERLLFEAARGLADEMCRRLGPGSNEGLPGHPGVEMALVELYRASGERSYLDLARHLIGSRGRGKIGGRAYNQDRVPVRLAREIEGHAVMQLYLLCGATDLYLETGDRELLVALEALWDDLVLHKMSISGGVGSRHEMESFGEAYELPNDRAYNETCAQIAAVMWSWRMLVATGSARYADHLEWTLYNGVLPGVSLGGTRFFYPNPLLSRGLVERSEWFDCACCPPNLMRTLSSLHTYVATATADEIQIHLYDASRIRATTAEGAGLDLAVETDYPWEGEVRVIVEGVRAGGARDLGLNLRIPAWCRRASVAVNGEAVAEQVPGGTYYGLRRGWHAGDVVRLDFDIEPVRFAAHPFVESARSAVALARGPLLYCFEDEDQPVGVSVIAAVLPPDSIVEARRKEDLLGGVVALEAAGGDRRRELGREALYRRIGEGEPPAGVAAATDAPGDHPPFFTGETGGVRLRAIPYFAWANRTRGGMRVWMPVAW